jgi:uncharacterized protein (DUF1330 family)
MTKGYWIARVDIADPEAYKGYVAANAAPLNKYGGHFLIRGGTSQLVEGTRREKNVVVEFPSYQAALDCWRSPEYQAAMSQRTSVSTMDLLIIEGYDGPQP